MSGGFIRDPLLTACGVAHGFGERGAAPPEDVRRPKQVHGATVTTASACAGPSPPDADAIVSDVAGLPVAVVTADCVPVLVAAADGRAVAAVHAGWRGLAAGVIRTGIDALRELAGDAPLVAVVGPHIGACCYEVDAPVIDGLGARFGAALADAVRPTRADHVALDLGRLARVELERAGLAPDAVGGIQGACTRCDAERFHSYRRDGTRSGRLVHFIAAQIHEA